MLACILPATAFAQLVIPEVLVDIQRLPEEAQNKLEGLDSLLTTFLRDPSQKWNRDDNQYDLPVQVSVYFTDYTANPQEDKYKANLIITNKQDARYDDKRWEFGLGQPIRFSSAQYDPFTGVILFYLWMIIGNEEDKYEKLGGRQNYEEARSVYLESTTSIYYFGWDKRIELLRSVVDESNDTTRELTFFYYTGIYFDEQGDYAMAKDYLYYALVKLNKVPGDIRDRFLELNHRQFAEALIRAGYTKGVSDLMGLDPGRREIYESVLPEGGVE